MVSVVAVVAAFALTAASGRAAQKNKEPQTLSNKQLAEALHVLRATNRTLEVADHDYGGHRADAVKAIGAAEHQLKLALEHGHKKSPAGKPGKKPAGGNEPQAISNMQLAEAIPVLKTTIVFLEKADHDYGGHRAEAVRDLKTAVVQLEKALAFEKKKEKK
jgi:hypothetical protein